MTRGMLEVRHNFETAHRLPFLQGKCVNLHGHSWWVTWQFSGELSPEGVVCEYGELKARLREWVDAALDHGTMLGHDDPLAAVLLEHGCKVHLFGDEHGPCHDLPWPTVENVAILLRRVGTEAIEHLQGTDLRCDLVRVQETHVNAALA